MVHRAQPTTFQERVEILERSVAGQSDPDIAAALYCSVWTVRKWRRIGQRQGRAGLAPPIGRPPGGPLGSVLPELREAILQLRRSHPGWGADTILAELRTDPLWAEHPLPSRARIAALFTHAKLTRRYNRHTELPEPAPATEGTPHDEWELDAQVERLHQTMTLQALLGQSWSDSIALWAGLDARRTMLNAHIPCRTLGAQAPLQAYPQASHSGRFYQPEWEAELLDLNRVYSYLATCRWFRRVAQNGSVALGGIYYYINPKYRGRAIEVTFDGERALFRGQVAGLEKAIEIIPRGLTKAALMGVAGMIAALPAYQLALPFTHEAQRVMDYMPLVRRMTLCDFTS